MKASIRGVYGTIVAGGVDNIPHVSDSPPAASIKEAVELAKLLSTEDSGRFVNMLLGRVAREHDRTAT